MEEDGLWEERPTLGELSSIQVDGDGVLCYAHKDGTALPIAGVRMSALKNMLAIGFLVWVGAPATGRGRLTLCNVSVYKGNWGHLL